MIDYVTVYIKQMNIKDKKYSIIYQYKPCLYFTQSSYDVTKYEHVIQLWRTQENDLSLQS